MAKASIKKSTIKRVEREGAALRREEGRALGSKHGKSAAAADSFQNFALNIGLGTNNALSGSTYGFNPITRVRTLLEWMYRGSWIAGQVVDTVAEDMTRAGIEITSTNKPEDIQKIQAGLVQKRCWMALNDTVKWGRLYGGSIGVFLIDGQKPDTPLRLETVGKGQFKGIMPLDRWMVEPSLMNLVSDYGPYLGLPMFYRVVSDAPAMRGQTIHYSRCIRLEGIRLPYWQRLMENLWGLSVFERLYDRMVSFDSATMGAAQLVYKSFIRTYKMDGLRDAQATGGNSLEGIMKFVDLMRKFQGIEGISLIDGKDEFEGIATAQFTGISDALLRFGEQLSGATGIPLVRLFGQSPAGLNSTGESDLRTYYDGINLGQERDLRDGVNNMIQIEAKSQGIKLPEDFSFKFTPLWQMDEVEKSDIADKDTKSVIETEAAGLISQKTALQELRTQSKKTGRWTNVTDEMIDAASDEIAPPIDEAALGEEGEGEENGSGKPGKPGNDPSEQGDTPLEQGLEAFKKIKRAVGDRRSGRDNLPFSEIGGLQIVIEQRAGTIRKGEGWSVVMPADYGYIRRVPSAEGRDEWLDCFVGPYHSSRDVWVIDAISPATRGFDEHKLMLGFRNSREAATAFRKSYNDPEALRIGAITRMSLDSLEFKDWIANGDKTRSMQPRLRRVA